MNPAATQSPRQSVLLEGETAPAVAGDKLALSWHLKPNERAVIKSADMHVSITKDGKRYDSPASQAARGVKLRVRVNDVVQFEGVGSVMQADALEIEVPKDGLIEVVAETVDGSVLPVAMVASVRILREWV
ncbi:hypothetical protein [Leeia sp.]|uniref:hypothetical protein n=1 Tax=Leeia sp. TaxID=2884678 RepID=UPI0035B07E02